MHLIAHLRLRDWHFFKEHVVKVDSQVRQRFHNLLKVLLTSENLFLNACCELVKENLTIIIIQRITHAFDWAFACAFDKSNVCGSHSNANV